MLSLSEAVVAGLFGLIGVIVGSGLAWLAGWLQDRKKTRIALNVEALKTLQGWRRVVGAYGFKPNEPNDEDRRKRIDDANWLLAEQLIAYEAALPSVSRRQGRGVHVKVIAEMNAQLSKHDDPNQLGPGDLESLDHSTKAWAETISQTE